MAHKDKELTINREMYQLAIVLLHLEHLKGKGFMEGGYTAQADKLEAIVAIGKDLGFPKPTVEEIKTICDSLQQSLL